MYNEIVQHQTHLMCGANDYLSEKDTVIGLSIDNKAKAKRFISAEMRRFYCNLVEMGIFYCILLHFEILYCAFSVSKQNFDLHFLNY